MNKVILGIVFSSVFVYFSVRGVEFDKIFEVLRNAKYIYGVIASLFILLSLALRSIRWAIILSPVKKIGQRSLFPVFSIGFMCVVLFPLRMGELVRAYLLRPSNHVPFGTALSTIFVERVFDMMTLLGIFLMLVLHASIPVWFLKAGYTSLIIFILVILFICFLYFRTEKTLKSVRPVLEKFPRRFQDRLEHLINNLVMGLKIIESPGKLLMIFFLSLMIWGISAFAIYNLFWFQELNLNLMAAFVVLVLTIIGVSLPTAPGMLGNFQFSCIVGLSLFNIDKDQAFVFSMVYYILGIGIVVFLGLVSLSFTDFSLRAIFTDMRRSVDL